VNQHDAIQARHKRSSRNVIHSVIAEAGASVFDSWFSNFWLVVIVKAGVVIGFYLTAFLVVSYMEHKVLAHMQHRIGPMYAAGSTAGRRSSPTG
jgi:general stress protein CsbA